MSSADGRAGCAYVLFCSRYHKKVEKDEEYIKTVVSLGSVMENLVKQNNAIDIYEDFFQVRSADRNQMNISQQDEPHHCGSTNPGGLTLTLQPMLPGSFGGSHCGSPPCKNNHSIQGSQHSQAWRNMSELAP